MSLTTELMKLAPLMLTLLLALLAGTLPWVWAANGRRVLPTELDSRPVEPVAHRQPLTSQVTVPA